jgi:hypothetical protein
MLVLRSRQKLKNLSSSRLAWVGGNGNFRLGERTKSFLCVLGLALLPFVLFWRLATLREFPVAGDIFAYNYPIQHLLLQQIRQGQFSVWDNRIFSGIPLLAQGQTGALYPLNLVLALMPTWAAMNYSLLAHYSLSGVFMYLYTRALGLGRKGAVVAGAAFIFCGFSIAHLGHLPIIRTIPWLPLLLWAVEEWRQHFELKYVGLGALGVGLMLVSGHPQIPVYALVVTAAYIVYFFLFPGRSCSRWKIAVGGGTIIGLGFVLAAPQIWGLYEAARFFERAPQYGSGFEFFASYSLFPSYLAHLIFPQLFGRDMSLTEMSGYMSILSWALAALAFFHWKHKARWFLLVTAVVSLVLVFGKYTPLYQFLYRVPVFNSFRVPPRHWFEFDFALAVLAGAGFDRLSSSDNARRLSRWAQGTAAALIALIGLIAVTVLWVAPGAFGQVAARNGVTSWSNPALWLPLVMILSSAAILLVVSFRPNRWYSAALTTGLIVADMFFSFAGPHFTAHSTQRSPVEVFECRPASVEFLKRDTSLYRQLTYSPVAKLNYEEWCDTLTPNLNILFDIDGVEGYEAAVPAQYMAFANDMFSGTGPSFHVHPDLFRSSRYVLDLLNVKYILVPVNQDALSFGNIASVDGIGLDIYPYPTLELGMSSGLVSATLALPTRPVTTLAIGSYLNDGAALADGQPVARVTVTDQEGRVSTFDLNAGQHTSELDYDCNASAMNHQKAPIAYDLPSGSCMHHVYFARFELSAQPVVLRQVTFESLLDKGHWYVSKVSLYNAQTQTSYPVSVAQGYMTYLTSNDAFRQVYEDKRVRIYENMWVLPRAFLATRVKQVESVEMANQFVHRGVFSDGRAFIPKEEAMIEASVPAPWLSNFQSSGSVSAKLEARVISAQAGRMEVRTSAERETFLVYSENYFPGWYASVDGRPVEVYRTDGTLLGVYVPAGEHRVVFTFRPLSLVLAFAASAAAWLVIAGLILSLVQHSPSFSSLTAGFKKLEVIK